MERCSPRGAPQKRKVRAGRSPKNTSFLEVIHFFQQVGCERNKLPFLTAQQNLKPSSVTGLRLDGLPALELWDLFVSVFGNVSRVSDRTGKLVNGEDKHHKVSE